MTSVSMVSREVILPEVIKGGILPDTMSFIVSSLPKMSKTEVTLLNWGYEQQNCFKISLN